MSSLSSVSRDGKVTAWRFLTRPSERTRAPDLLWQVARAAADVVTLSGAVVVTWAITPGPERLPLLALAGFALIAGASFASRGAYASRLRIDIFDDLRTVAVGVSLAAVIVLAAVTLTGWWDGPKSAVVRPWLFALVYVSAGRIAIDLWQAEARRRGRELRPTLIIGAGRVGQLAARRIAERPEFGLKPVGFLDKDPLIANGQTLPLPVLGASWDLERVIEEHRVRQVIVAFSKAPHEVVLNMTRRCEMLGVPTAFVPRLFERVSQNVAVEHIGGLPLLAVHTANPKGWQFAIKHAFDRVAAALLIVICAPMLIGAAIAVRISLGRPILFRQLRVGRDDRPFKMLKFRTLKPPLIDEVEDIATPERRTGVGEFLRRTSIDELPQLFNVIRGEMSLVGPRPERPELVDVFMHRVHRYSDRHRVRAGITGWAQIHGLGRGVDRFGDVPLSDRVEWDNYYIENWSLWLDVKILALTALAVFRFSQPV